MARFDSKHRKLRTGESQKSNGTYTYRWTTRDGVRHSVGANTLEELRKKQDDISRDRSEGIKQCSKNVTLNTIFELWKATKRGLKDNTLQNYVWSYMQYVYDDPIGTRDIKKLKRTDIKRFYNKLYDERNLKIGTIDNVHTVLHQVFQLAVDDDYIRKNISDNLLKELKAENGIGESHKRALTVPEQKLFLEYLDNESNQYYHWYSIFAVLLGTGLRVGELTGLRWSDIDLDKGIIDVNHTLVYYNHNIASPSEKNKCYFAINTPKTTAGKRKVPMQEYVKEAFIRERENQNIAGISCNVSVDGYTDFIFINRFGNVQHQGTLNKALKRIIRDCNEEQITKANKGNEETILLPNFSCHSLRHTFVTRLCEADMNIKVIQELAGHSSSDVTLDIYTTVMEEFKTRQFKEFEEKMNQ